MNGEKSLKNKGKENSIRKRALTSNGVRNTEDNIIINQVLKSEDFWESRLLFDRKEQLEMLSMRRNRTLC